MYKSTQSMPMRSNRYIKLIEHNFNAFFYIHAIKNLTYFE